MSAQITLEERYAIQAMKKLRFSIRAIARALGRSPSTISRELSRDLRPSGRYNPDVAHSYCVARRRRSRRNTRFTGGEWVLVEHLIGLDWSPEQVSGWLKPHGIMSISHETICLRIFRDKNKGGELWRHLRQAAMKRRKRYRSHDSRGRPPGKRHISERPPEAETREATGVPFYFATPHHSWERGTNENTNGLIRQYLPKRTSMAHIEQADLDAIAHKLNTRPGKRLGFRTPEECYPQAR